MNIWMAAGWIFGCISFALTVFMFLIVRQMLAGIQKDNLMLIDRMHGIEAERDSLRAQNQRTLGDNTALIDGMHEQEVQIHELRAQLANGHAASRKRASRTKPPTTTE